MKWKDFCSTNVQANDNFLLLPRSPLRCDLYLNFKKKKSCVKSHPNTLFVVKSPRQFLCKLHFIYILDSSKRNEYNYQLRHRRRTWIKSCTRNSHCFRFNLPKRYLEFCKILPKWKENAVADQETNTPQDCQPGTAKINKCSK